MTITQSFLTTEISNLWPDNTTGLITPANARQTLNDMVTAIFQGVFTSTTSGQYGVLINASGTTTGGLGVSQALTGAPLGGNAGNLINIVSDDRGVGAGTLGVGFLVSQTIGGGGMTGNRAAIQGNTLFTSASSNTGLQSYGGVGGLARASSSDGGTGTTFSTAKGQISASNMVGSLATGATNWLAIQGEEIDVEIQTGASAAVKQGLLIAKLSTDAVQGSLIDAALNIADQNGAGSFWSTGILFGQPSVFTGAQWPFNSSSTVIGCANPGTVGSVIDFHLATISGDALNFPNAILSGAGVWTLTPGDNNFAILVAGSAKGVRIRPTATSGVIEGVDNTGAGSFQPLTLGGSALHFPLSGGSDAMTILAGVQVGAPTGGDKGAGTINVSSGIFLNNTSYTNPDYVFEKEFTGKIEKYINSKGADRYEGRLSFSELRNHVKNNLRLPGICEGPTDIFERADIVLEKLEELTLYILDLDDRLNRLN